MLLWHEIWPMVTHSAKCLSTKGVQVDVKGSGQCPSLTNAEQVLEDQGPKDPNICPPAQTLAAQNTLVQRVNNCTSSLRSFQDWLTVDAAVNLLLRGRVVNNFSILIPIETNKVESSKKSKNDWIFVVTKETLRPSGLAFLLRESSIRHPMTQQEKTYQQNLVLPMSAQLDQATIQPSIHSVYALNRLGAKIILTAIRSNWGKKVKCRALNLNCTNCSIWVTSTKIYK